MTVVGEVDRGSDLYCGERTTWGDVGRTGGTKVLEFTLSQKLSGFCDVSRSPWQVPSAPQGPGALQTVTAATRSLALNSSAFVSSSEDSAQEHRLMVW